jgi:formamidopyrimidine-DNA glycosylase
LKPGRGPIALRVHLDSGGGFDVTEAGTQKRLAVWLVSDPAAVPGVASLGPDALSLTAGQLHELLGPHGGRIKTVHDAVVSVLTDAVQRSVGQQAATLKGEKRSGLRVHARTGLPCPVCGDTVREVSFADKSFQYCPGCQTGGKVLADRRMSRLLK